MKRFFVILVAVITFSCSSKDDDTVDPLEAYYKEAILGSWAYDTVVVDGQTYLYDHVDNCTKDLFQFYNQPGKRFDFEETVILDCDNCAECASSSTNLRWELDGDIIKFYFGEPLVLIYKIIEVNETSFTYQVRFDYDDDGDEDLLEFTSVPYDPYNEFE